MGGAAVRYVCTARWVEAEAAQALACCERAKLQLLGVLEWVAAGTLARESIDRGRMQAVESLVVWRGAGAVTLCVHELYLCRMLMA